MSEENGASRMTLAKVKSSRKETPDRILLVGTEGIGKSTFAADAPSPIFIAAEDGISQLDVQTFPQPRTFPEVMDAVGELIDGQHGYKTLVLDTVDWIEPLVWSDLCRRNSWQSIESPGYGKGYVEAVGEWRRLLASMELLRKKRRMEIILLAHAQIKVFNNPAGDDYNRYECKLHRGTAALLKEWTDTNLFAIHEEFVQPSKGGQKGKGVSTGLRIIHTERNAAWDAKNRWGLPPTLPLSYQEYAAARAAGAPADPGKLQAEAFELLDALELPAEEAATINSWVRKHGDNATVLAKGLNKLRARLAAKEAA